VIHQHNIYEELCRIREILAMQTVLTGLKMKDLEYPDTPQGVIMGEHYHDMMVKALRMAFPERILRERTEEEFQNEVADWRLDDLFESEVKEDA